MDKGTSFSEKQSLNCNGKIITLDRARIMGIINLTPDSFYDGSLYNSPDKVFGRVDKMVSEGADIIDIGGVSTRPGAKEVTEEDEKKRLLPLLEQLLIKFPQTIFSVDTYRSEIAYLSISAGAHMINDISGGTFDNKMKDVINSSNVPYVLMHIKGTPKNMQKEPVYMNLTGEIRQYFQNQISHFKEEAQLVLDPGFGFGKTLHNNYSLLKHLNDFRSFGYPLLAGVSRKSMINRILKTKPAEALNGTTALNMLALLNGVDILRVHDVKEAWEVIKLYQYYTDVD